MSEPVRAWLKMVAYVGAAVLAAYGATHNWVSAAGAGLAAMGLYLDKGSSALAVGPTLLSSTLAPLASGSSFAAGVAKSVPAAATALGDLPNVELMPDMDAALRAAAAARSMSESDAKDIVARALGGDR